MFKRLARSPVIPYVLGTLIWAYQAILTHTLRWRIEGEGPVRALYEGNGGTIIAAWHSRILLMPLIVIRLRRRWRKPSARTALMVSASRDGEFTARAGRLLGLHIIRGSAANPSKTKDKRGVAAAREAIAAMKRGASLIVTVDGPKGPSGRVGIGAIKLAQQTQSAIIIYGLSADARRLDTWDRLLLPLPFSRAAAVFAEPVTAYRDSDPEEIRREVEARLRWATARADALAGQRRGAGPESDAEPTGPGIGR
ncbi:MAG: DUF374 domain-containing protein [Alphaproteobacteria bacterium]|nr:DUF374 domain-containing protein [Alphaproteobacteria bacterium]